MTREEAINIVRNIYQTDKEKEALATLIPELRESEDERIIRLLRELGSLDAAKELYEEFNLSYTDVLYWLEKQKEQKPVEKPINWTELTWKDIVELEGIINNVHYEFRNGIGQESFGKEVLEKFREYKEMNILMK